MLDCVCPETEQNSIHGSLLTDAVAGVSEHPVIGPANEAEGILAGKMNNKHGFHVRRLNMEPGASLPFHARLEEEVFYLRSGRVAFEWEGGKLNLAEGDVLTVPKGLMHGYRAEGDAPAVACLVRGGNQPQAAVWLDQSAETTASN